MAVLGKRKASEQAPAAPTTSAEDAEEIFRRHFEARFKPLDDVPAPKKVNRSRREGDEEESEDEGNAEGSDEEDEEDEDGDDGEDDEWGGLSNDEQAEDTQQSQQVVEVVDHSSSQKPKLSTMSKRELKAFMSSRPPNASSQAANSSTTSRDSSSASAPALPEDAPSLLAQDLELRRLLSESHLLSALNKTSSSSSSPNGGELKAFATGRTRQKATDMRIQALGSKVSILKQDKMPMNIRKGVVALANARETKRRREAKENGVILEREAPKKSKGSGRRKEFGLDRPGVGRLSGASLKLSDRDIRSIEGTRDTFGRRGRR